MNTLSKRIITALISGPGVLALIFFSKRNNFPWAVGLFLAISAGIAVFELCILFQKADINVRPACSGILATLGFFAYVWFSHKFTPIIVTTVLSAAILINLGFESIKENIKSAAAVILGFIYIPWLLHYFYLIFIAESGVIHSANVLFIVWGFDSGAYFVGRFFGTHKIAPNISPNKTAEGVLGGIFMAYVGASLSPIWVPYRQWIPHLILIAILVGLAAQLGDLVESVLKRLAGLKDSGSIFPGHGGVLDRIDGLLFALPVFYFYFHFILRFV